MNATEVVRLLAPYGEGTSWKDVCVRHLKNANPLDVAAGLVKRYGEKAEIINGQWDVWGIDFHTCQRFCGRSSFPLVFDFPIFTSGVTNYFLPWLGLTAQLPYETGSSANNFMSFCIAVGSPMLITFSLISTALNAHWTNKRFSRMLSHHGPDGQLRKAAKAARNVLMASQQAPLRINSVGFTQLINGDFGEATSWWTDLQQQLESTRRTVTFSLFAQTSIAVIAWGITIIASYSDYLGIPTQALLLSSGTLWVWLIPVVVGWILVRMQAKEDTIERALKNVSRLPEQCSTAPLRVQPASEQDQDEPESLWGTIRGDESQQGPAFNYSRIFTYYAVTETVAKVYESRIKQATAVRSRRESRDPSEGGISARDSLLRHSDETRHDRVVVSTHTSEHRDIQLYSYPSNRCRSSIVPSPSTPSASVQARNLSVPSPVPSAAPTEPNTPLDVIQCDDYVEWTALPSSWQKHFLVSNVFAAFLQWGVAGSALLIAIMTEVRGLSCYSGSFLIYGILGTLAHILLVTSVFLSHHSMLLIQREQRRNTEAEDHTPEEGRRTLLHVSAVLTRYIGKFVAATNAVWIILSSIFELCGMYESCWCTSSWLTWGNRGWIVLFISAFQLRETAQGSWAGGIVMSSTVATITLAIIWRYSK